MKDLRRDFQRIADPERAKMLQRFFKTGKGEYGEGDIFLGIAVPVSRKLAIKYKNLPFRDIRELLKSKIHEERLVALLIMVHNFKTGSDSEKKKVLDYYLSNTKYINNWDLVDLSADKILGEYLIDHDSELLFKLSGSDSLWERRIAMIATYAFIRRGNCSLTFEIAEKLITDRNDLIQKAVGWMLREVGKRCGQASEEEFLAQNYKRMGRTALRYAIEHFRETKRKRYLTGGI